MAIICSAMPYLKVKDTHLAEDMVQEALLAAIASWSGFTNQSSVRTWLTAIFKYKLIDQIAQVLRDKQAGNRSY